MKCEFYLMVFCFLIFQYCACSFDDEVLAEYKIESLHVVCFSNVYIGKENTMLASFVVSTTKPHELCTEFFFSCDSFVSTSMTTFFSVSDIPLIKSPVIDDNGDTVRFQLLFEEQFIKEYFPPYESEVLCGSRNELVEIALANIFGMGDVYYYQNGKRFVLPKSGDFKFYIGPFPSSLTF